MEDQDVPRGIRGHARHRAQLHVGRELREVRIELVRLTRARRRTIADEQRADDQLQAQHVIPPVQSDLAGTPRSASRATSNAACGFAIRRALDLIAPSFSPSASNRPSLNGSVAALLILIAAPFSSR